MKTLVFANQKGGVGKSAIAVQLAYYLAEVKKQRVLFIDLDHQGNSSKAIKLSGLATLSLKTASSLLTSWVDWVEADPFVLIAADGNELMNLEKRAANHNQFAGNLNGFCKGMAEQFDFCIIDTNPNPDIRQLSALIAADFVLAPIQLNQEAIDGIAGLLNHEKIGIKKIQAALNPKLKLLGILPNLVEPTPFQRNNLAALVGQFSSLLIKTEAGYAAIKKSTAIAEAQAAGLPVWKLQKTSARDGWNQIKPVFDTLFKEMSG